MAWIEGLIHSAFTGTASITLHLDHGSITRLEVKEVENTNRLRGELATKAAILRDAATALRIGVAPETIAARLGVQLHALHALGEKSEA
jgi:hypothetical protein